MPKTAGAVRRKMKTPAEGMYKTHKQNFVNLSVQAAERFSLFIQENRRCDGFTIPYNVMRCTNQQRQLGQACLPRDGADDLYRAERPCFLGSRSEDKKTAPNYNSKI